MLYKKKIPVASIYINAKATETAPSNTMTEQDSTVFNVFLTSVFILLVYYFYPRIFLVLKFNFL